MRKDFYLALVFQFLIFSANAQWSNSGDNYTTGVVGIGLNNTSSKQLWVEQSNANHSAVFTTGHPSGLGIIVSAPHDPLRISGWNDVSGNFLIVKGDGRVGIGTTNPNASYKLHVNGGIYAASFYAYSDQRLKTEIEEDFAEFRNIYDVKTYEYELDGESTGKKHFGVLAQELKNIYPNLVSGNDESGYGVNYNEMIPLLIRALQDQKHTINLLSERIQNLQSQRNDKDSEEVGDKVPQLENLFPNPANSKFVLELSNNENYRSKFEISNLNGEIIDTFIIEGKNFHEVETSHLKNGIYYLRFIRNDEYSETRRIIVEH